MDKMYLTKIISLCCSMDIFGFSKKILSNVQIFSLILKRWIIIHFFKNFAHFYTKALYTMKYLNITNLYVCIM